LDAREQDGSLDYFEGGYTLSEDTTWSDNLVEEDIAWSNGSTLHLTHSGPLVSTVGV